MFHMEPPLTMDRISVCMPQVLRGQRLGLCVSPSSELSTWHIVGAQCGVFFLNGHYPIMPCGEESARRTNVPVRVMSRQFRALQKKENCKFPAPKSKVESLLLPSHSSLIWLLINNLLHPQKGSF